MLSNAKINIKILYYTRRLRRLASASRWHTPPPPSLQWGIMYIRTALDLNVSLEALTIASAASGGKHGKAVIWFKWLRLQKLTQSCCCEFLD